MKIKTESTQQDFIDGVYSMGNMIAQLKPNSSWNTQSLARDQFEISEESSSKLKGLFYSSSPTKSAVTDIAEAIFRYCRFNQHFLDRETENLLLKRVFIPLSAKASENASEINATLDKINSLATANIAQIEKGMAVTRMNQEAAIRAEEQAKAAKALKEAEARETALRDALKKMEFERDNKAAHKIQKAWRRFHYKKEYHGDVEILKKTTLPNHQVETVIEFDYQYIGSKEAPKSEMPLPTIEKFIKRLVKLRDRNGLRRLAHILFSGPWSSNQLAVRRQDSAPLINGLIALLYDPQSDLADIEKVMMRSIKDWRENYSQPYVTTEEKLKKLIKNQDYYGQKMSDEPKQPDDYINITHGGGLEHLQDFLNGMSQGYPLEAGGTGIQVSPVATVRDPEYAGKATQYFDIPAVLRARIQAKHLKAAPNGYEAGLPPQSVNFLENVSLTPLPSSRVTFSSLPMQTQYEKMCQERLGDAQIGTRIYESQQRCFNAKGISMATIGIQGMVGAVSSSKGYS